MDADQFRILIRTIREDNQEFVASIGKELASAIMSGISEKIQGTAQPSTSSQVSNIAPFEPFDQKAEKFKNYLERFENYLAVKNVTADHKKAQLLSVSIGSLHYNNLSALLGPDSAIKNLEYAPLKKAFSDMLTPHRNVVVSQHYFLNTYQKPNETIPEFVASLQRDISDCEFSVLCECNQKVSVADIFLRAQFIRGLKDSWIREQLLQSTATTFKDILTKATALEASRLETQVLSNRQPASPDSILDDIHKVSKRPTRQTFQNSKYRSVSPSFNRSKSQTRFQRKMDYSKIGVSNLCFFCARNNHRASDCRVDRKSLHCTSCDRTGHVAK
ncbi:unnamed protein product, partial [Nesidiocoris tenuis]